MGNEDSKLQLRGIPIVSDVVLHRLGPWPPARFLGLDWGERDLLGTHPGRIPAKWGFVGQAGGCGG